MRGEESCNMLSKFRKLFLRKYAIADAAHFSLLFNSESSSSFAPQWSSSFQQSSITGANLSVSGLPVGVKEEDVLKLFSRFGHVSSCTVAAEWGTGYLAYDSEAKVDIESSKLYGEGLAAPASVLENRQSALEAAKKARQILHGYQLDSNSAIKLEVTQF